MSYVEALQALRQKVQNTDPVAEAAKAMQPVSPRGFMPAIASSSSRAPVSDVPQYAPLDFARDSMREIHAASQRFQEARNKDREREASKQSASGGPAAAALSGFVARRNQQPEAESGPTATDIALSGPAGGPAPEVNGPAGGPVPVTDYIRYSNSNATRNDPLSEELVASMSFLGDMGITADVISGGQENNTTEGTGSERHNHGQSADVDFYIGDRKLDWNNPDDLPIFQEIVTRARDSGITGIGAGDDYMGAGRMHLGFGNPGVWGANGRGANAPSWLREAYYG